ncbi:MAG: DNA translocase FtsK, partial [Candidatus Binataceae bacterium]
SRFARLLQRRPAPPMRGSDVEFPRRRVEPTFGRPVVQPVQAAPEDDDIAEEEPPAPRKPRAPPKPLRRAADGYALPSLNLLSSPRAGERTTLSAELIRENGATLEGVLADFGVRGEIINARPGPVVTLYELEPAPGIKSSRVISLADDIARSMSALSARVAVVSGRNAIGIELPNPTREKVYLRELLASRDYAETEARLPLCLGKAIGGEAVLVDLARMPHLLIAGTTGSGKSVALNARILSLLYQAELRQVRLILIDPKMLELSVYENIPHLLVPVVIDPEKAAAALFWATQEMENRYRMMRDFGVRNIDGYNRIVGAKGNVVALEPDNVIAEMDTNDVGDEIVPAPIEHKKLPKIVIVIDELADLLLSEGKSVERDITRLAQKARAAGIHLILATQRPSVDVITGLIKANLPARISLQVTSRVDSRTILDSIGAERLLGAGDMLYMPPGSAKLIRLHGPFVSEAEIRKVIDFLRSQGAPDYRMEILETKSAADEGGDDYGGGRDELYDEAVRIVIETNQASISMIQRRLRVGYNRAARMVEQMEREGLVAPPDGARPREVRGLRTAH